MNKYTVKQFEDIIMPWWDNLSINRKEELTMKYFPRFSVSMMDGDEIEELFEKLMGPWMPHDEDHNSSLMFGVDNNQ